uniref:BSD domain-containing protein n=1 Tax=Setaria digitata TaxID=48799 RepID=A0A915PIX2_9BILA
MRNENASRRLSIIMINSTVKFQSALPNSVVEEKTEKEAESDEQMHGTNSELASTFNCGKMRIDENGTGEETETSNKQFADNKKEVEKSVEDSFQGWVTSGTAWGSAWFRSAKEKTYTTFELVKRDLTEFGDVVANEASALANTTVESVRQQAQNLHQIINFEEVDDKQHEEGEKVESDTNETERTSLAYAAGWTSKLPSVPTIADNAWIKAIVDALKNIAQENTIEGENEFTERIYPHVKSVKRSDLPHHILYDIQTNPDTYAKIPEGDEELFKMWKDQFKLIDYDAEINTLLANSPPVRALYQDMVPGEIEDMVFWARYFYKVHQTELLVRCKIDAEKPLLQKDRNEIIQKQKKMTDFIKKGTTKTESRSNVDAELAQNQNSPDRRSIPDESWSICSSTNVDIQELHDEDGPQTPKAESNNSSSRSDGWINWDE